jgi:GNAT superfamily N-acetyltransferase
MVNPFEIRRAIASEADAAAIQIVEHNSLGDSSYSLVHILQLLRNPAHYPYLAWLEDNPVGFCWCFETPFSVGNRLEVDLLGVLPAYRQQHIATNLIQVARSEAQQRGIKVFRGVIARDNLPSQHAFLSAGFSSGQEPGEMLVYRLAGRKPAVSLPEHLSWRIVPGSGYDAEADNSSGVFTAKLLSGVKLVATADCLLVNTLIYRGVWIERLDGAEEDILLLVRALIAWCAQQALDELGILCSHYSLTQSGQYEALWRAGLESWGGFYIFS